MQGEVTQRESTLQSPVCRVQLMYSLNGIDAHSPSYPNGLTSWCVDTGFLPPPSHPSLTCCGMLTGAPMPDRSQGFFTARVLDPSQHLSSPSFRLRSHARCSSADTRHSTSLDSHAEGAYLPRTCSQDPSALIQFVFSPGSRHVSQLIFSSLTLDFLFHSPTNNRPHDNHRCY